MKKNRGGRPTKYSKKIIEKAREYLDNCNDEYDEFHKTRGLKSNTYERIINVNIPTIEDLALYLKISRETVYDWRDKYSEFSDIVKEVQITQASRLIKGGLSGTYNPAIAKVLLTKHGYRDAVDSDLTSGGEKISGVTIQIQE